MFTLVTVLAGLVVFTALLATLWRVGHRPYLVVEIHQVREVEHRPAVVPTVEDRRGSRPELSSGARAPARVVRPLPGTHERNQA